MTQRQNRSLEERRLLAKVAAELIAGGKTHRQVAKVMNTNIRDVQRLLADFPAFEIAARLSRRLEAHAQRRTAARHRLAAMLAKRQSG